MARSVGGNTTHPPLTNTAEHSLKLVNDHHKKSPIPTIATVLQLAAIDQQWSRCHITNRDAG